MARKLPVVYKGYTVYQVSNYVKNEESFNDCVYSEFREKAPRGLNKGSIYLQVRLD